MGTELLYFLSKILSVMTFLSTIISVKIYVDVLCLNISYHMELVYYFYFKKYFLSIFIHRKKDIAQKSA